LPPVAGAGAPDGLARPDAGAGWREPGYPAPRRVAGAGRQRPWGAISGKQVSR
jgi:hypothetical protein